MASLTEQTSPPQRRVFRTSSGSSAAIIIDDDRIVIMGDTDHFVVVDKNGITIKGPRSDISASENNRKGGLWTTIPDFVAMLPSTIVTPLPQQIITPPTAGISQLKDTMLIFTSLLG